MNYELSAHRLLFLGVLSPASDKRDLAYIVTADLVSNPEQEAQLPQRNSASAVHVYLYYRLAN